MRKFLCILFIILINNGIYAQSDSLSVNTNQPKEVKERGFKKFLSNFTRIDSSYIEPQQFNFAFMLQNTNTYELYRLKSDKNQSVTLAPNPSIRVGPFFGWRWIFLGYTFDISHLNDNSGKQEFNLSLYSAQVGIDLFYKKTGNDYKIKNIDLGNSISTKNLTSRPVSKGSTFIISSITTNSHIPRLSVKAQYNVKAQVLYLWALV